MTLPPRSFYPSKNQDMKTINIYLTRDQKQRLDKIRAKYKISLSTLTGKLVYWTYDVLNKENNDEIKELIQTEYIQKEHNYKTSVKPRELNEVLGNEIKKKSIFASNCIVIYIEKQINKYVKNKKLIDRYYNKIDHDLTESKEIYWDYNIAIRNQTRMIKHNKEYFKRVLEEV